MARAVCKLCGAKRDFPSSAPSGSFTTVVPQAKPAAAKVEKAKVPKPTPVPVKTQEAKFREGEERLCAVCGEPFSAYRETQMTCKRSSCRRTWKWRDIRP